MRWRAPLEGVLRVVRPFAAPARPWSRGHRGVDLAAPAGTAVRAPSDGVVAFAGRIAGRGVVSLVHGDGLRTTYEPVRTVVDPGAQVTRGTVLGLTEPDSRHRGALHWGVRVGDRYIDPMSLLRSAPVLKPSASRPRVGLREGRPQPLHRDMGVDLRRAEAGVAEEFLDGAQVRTPLQDVGGRRMS